MKKLEIDTIQEIFAWLQTTANDFNCKTSIAQHITKLGDLCSALTFTNQSMVLAKKKLNAKKVKAYLNIPPDIQQLSTSLIKDFINSSCVRENFNYDLCERLSRTLTHTISSMITSISALKTSSPFNRIYEPQKRPAI